MKFKIDLKIFLFIIIFYFTKQIETYAIIIFFAIIHELGHLIAGLALGMKPESIKLIPFGLSISFKLNPRDYNKKIGTGNLFEIKKIIVAVAGPLINFFIILIASHINLNILSNLIIIYVNLLIMLFNLIPIYPLDGGRILKGILHMFVGKKESDKYTNYISFVSLLILTFLGSIEIYYLKNIAIFFIIIFLWILYITEDIIHKRRLKIYNLIEKTIEIRRDK
ncbi:MAG: site-2 protease family protein [Clostridia bacterium]|nr:site-2 protease family protein [Clostridia bacterium]